MLDKEIVSVIIPIYNVEKYLKRCVDSVLNQSYHDLQIILVNDGSSDGSELICQQYQSQDDRIKVIHKENGGLASARNAGKKKALGKYVLFIDSDDWIEKNTIEQLVSIANRNYLDVLTYCFSVDFTDRNTTHSIKARCSMLPDEYNQKEIALELLDSGLINSSCNKLYRADCIKSICFKENSEPIEDIVFNAEVFASAPQIAVVNNAFYHYVKDGQDSIVTKYKKNILETANKRSNAFKEIADAYGLTGELVDICLAKEYLIGRSDCILNNYRKHADITCRERIDLIRRIKTDSAFRRSIVLCKHLEMGFAEKVFVRVIWLPAFMVNAIYDILFYFRNRYNNLYVRVRER